MSQPTARLRSLALAVPPYRLNQDEVMDRAGHLFPEKHRDDLERLLPVFVNAGIQTRYSCVPPDWYERPHSWAEKNQLYLDNAVDLLEQAACEAIGSAGLRPADIDCVVAVSTTGIATPSLDALIMERLGLRRDVRRLPIFGLGCAGGVIGLARATEMAQILAPGNVLFLVVELCALTFRRSDMSKSNVIATALFGDGGAAAVVSCDGEGLLEIGPAGEHTWRDSLDVMGWSVEDDGLGVIFSRDIPTLTRTAFADALSDYLARHGLSLDEMDHYACHPGGAKVLDALEEVFGLPSGGLKVSRGVLGDYGNMSAATVMFVLHRMIQDGARGQFLLSALGPGFTAAFLTAMRP